ncbi:MAG: hypothetical protein ABJA82_03300 [Myxococcales bacterium]
MTNHSLAIVMMSVAMGCGGAGKDQPGVGNLGGAGAGGSGGVGTGEGMAYTLDLKEFGTTQTPGGLAIANETLVLPLALGPTEQSLSHANPGDLVVAYTRVGCGVDPEGWIGTEGVVPVQLPQVQPVALIEVAIDQFVGVGVTANPSQLAERTCLTLKSPGGPWMPFLQPQKITLLSAASVRTEFVIDRTSAESAAIFLPTYTFVSRISYQVATP